MGSRRRAAPARGGKRQCLTWDFVLCHPCEARVAGHEAEEVRDGQVSEGFKCQGQEFGLCPEGKKGSFVLFCCLFFSFFLDVLLSLASVSISVYGDISPSQVWHRGF